jgi:anti-sigma factor RsiW
MNCDELTRTIPLYLYSELSFDEEEQVERHLESCAACRTEVERNKAILKAFDQVETKADDGLLAECRQELMRAVGREAARGKPSLWQSIAAFWISFGNIRVPVGMAAALVVGFLAGRVVFFGPRQAPPSEPLVSTIRSLEPDASGRVHIALDETRRRTVSGNLNDPGIQQLLLAAARDEVNPGIRFESLEILKDHAASGEVRSALVRVLQKDPNPGVRLKALEGLKQFSGDESIRKSLVGVLQADDNAGVRVQAIDLLMQQRDQSMVGVFQGLMRKENNNYVRMRVANALEEMNASAGVF